MAKKIDIKKFDPKWLNGRCRSLMAQYATTAYEVDGTILKVTEPDGLARLVDHARNTYSAKLKCLYLDLKTELKAILKKPELQKQISKLLHRHRRDEISDIAHGSDHEHSRMSFAA